MKLGNLTRLKYRLSSRKHRIYIVSDTDIEFNYVVICSRKNSKDMYFLYDSHLSKSNICMVCRAQDKKLTVFNNLLSINKHPSYPTNRYYELENWEINEDPV